MAKEPIKGHVQYCIDFVVCCTWSRVSLCFYNELNSLMGGNASSVVIRSADIAGQRDGPWITMPAIRSYFGVGCSGSSVVHGRCVAACDHTVLYLKS